MTALRLMIVDRHRAFLNSARQYLMQCYNLDGVMVSNDFGEAMSRVTEYRPDIILVGVDLLRQAGTLQVLVDCLKEKLPATSVFVLTLFQGDSYRLVKPGSNFISGYIAKDQFAERINLVINNEVKEGE